mmetsp:Transcript_6372/g.14415  ORF Transcript_6372/g.14415 Transcript_6372/m.14415 type:complete len:257 (+) Transcript_6372:1422-2192(+)
MLILIIIRFVLFNGQPLERQLRIAIGSRKWCIGHCIDSFIIARLQSTGYTHPILISRNGVGNCRIDTLLSHGNIIRYYPCSPHWRYPARSTFSPLFFLLLGQFFLCLLQIRPSHGTIPTTTAIIIAIAILFEMQCILIRLNGSRILFQKIESLAKSCMCFSKCGCQCHCSSGIDCGGAVSFETEEGGGTVGEKDVGGWTNGGELEGGGVGVVCSRVFLSRHMLIPQPLHPLRLFLQLFQFCQIKYRIFCSYCIINC